jgi:hypothetical protein
MPGAPVPFIPSVLLFPSQRRPLYFHGYQIHTRLHSGWKMSLLPMLLLVSLQATTIYSRAVAHTTNILSYVFCW